MWTGRILGVVFRIFCYRRTAIYCRRIRRSCTCPGSTDSRFTRKEAVNTKKRIKTPFITLIMARKLNRLKVDINLRNYRRFCVINLLLRINLGCLNRCLKRPIPGFISLYTRLNHPNPSSTENRPFFSYNSLTPKPLLYTLF